MDFLLEYYLAINYTNRWRERRARAFYSIQHNFQRMGENNWH